MSWRIPLAIIALLAIAAPSNAAPLCTLTVATVPILDPLSTAAAPGDLTGSCSDLAVGPTFVTFSYFFNTDVVPSTTPTLTTDLNVAFNGTFFQANAVAFSNVSVSGPTFGFTIENILVNPSLLGPNTQVVSFLSAAGVLPISNPQNAVALVGTPVPEPGSLILLGIGLAAWRGTRPRRGTSVGFAYNQPRCCGSSPPVNHTAVR